MDEQPPKPRRGRAGARRLGEVATSGNGNQTDSKDETNVGREENPNYQRIAPRLPIRITPRNNPKRTAILEFCLIMSIFVSAGSLFSLAVMGFSIAQAVHEEFILEKQTSANMQAIIDNIKKDLADVEALKKSVPPINRKNP